MTPENEHVFRLLVEQSALLEMKGFAPLAPFWRDTLELWYECGVARLVGEVGRRGGKSLTMRRVAIAEALGRSWPIPEGERGVIAYISANARHARRRVRELARMLRALGYDVDVALSSGSGEVRMKHHPIDFVVFACTGTAVVGDLWLALIADEMSRWKDDDKSADPATEVMASARPSLFTMREHGAREMWISSPLAESGLFHNTVHSDEGEEHPGYPDAWFRLDDIDGLGQLVVHAPTWVAHPALTRAATHREEPDEQVWRREYLAEPMPRVQSAGLDPRLINWLDTPPTLRPGDMVMSGSDLALVRDATALAIVIKRADRFILTHLEEWCAPVQLTEACVDIRARLKHYSARATTADQHYRERLREVLAESGLLVEDAPPAVDAVVRFRDLIREGRFDAYVPNTKCRTRFSQQLDETELAVTSSGRIRVLHPRTNRAHGDMVDAVALACWAESGVAPIERPRTYPNDKQRAMARAAKRRRERDGKSGKRPALW